MKKPAIKRVQRRNLFLLCRAGAGSAKPMKNSIPCGWLKKRKKKINNDFGKRGKKPIPKHMRDWFIALYELERVVLHELKVSSDNPDIHTEPTSNQFIVDDILHDMILLLLADIQPRVAQSHVAVEILLLCTDVFPSLDVIALRFLQDESSNENTDSFDQFSGKLYRTDIPGWFVFVLSINKVYDTKLVNNNEN